MEYLKVTYAEEVFEVKKKTIYYKRRLENGVETVECPTPCVITVNGSAADCRPRNAKAIMKYKHARTSTERQEAAEDYMNLVNERPYLDLPELSVNDIEVDLRN